VQYFGGKQRVATELVVEIQRHRTGDSQLFFEPFLGGANIVTLISGRRAAADANIDLITMYKALQQGWVPPSTLSAEEYALAKALPEGTTPIKAFAGFGCSFAGKWFGGYAKSGVRNYALNAKNSLEKKRSGLQGVALFAKKYNEFTPIGALVYCDPPYQGTTQYGAVGEFNTAAFWDTMRQWAEQNIVLVSEYAAPDNCEVVWEKHVITDIRGTEGKLPRVEKLFLVHP